MKVGLCICSYRYCPGIIRDLKISGYSEKGVHMHAWINTVLGYSDKEEQCGCAHAGTVPGLAIVPQDLCIF